MDDRRYQERRPEHVYERPIAPVQSETEASQENQHHHAPEPVEQKAEPKKETHKKPLRAKRFSFLTLKNLLIGGGVVFAVCFVFLAYGYIHTRNELTSAKNPSANAKNETEKIVAVVGKSVELPASETPKLATVDDISKLKGQQFFSNAQNGDKVLVYQKAGMAVLYRPSTQKVILYSFVNPASSQQQSQ